MKVLTNTITGLILFLVSAPFYTSAQDSTYYDNKHQIGINASKFIVLFNEQVNSIELSYRKKINYPYSLRGGLSYEHNTAEDGLFNASARLGIDRYFKEKTKWKFYYGAEAYFSKTILNSSDRETTKYGGFVFLGLLYHLSESFSLSTEPNFSVLRIAFKDPDSFDPDANRSWYEFRLGNIGQIQLNFHF